ncbi:RluA family pseudouridine synthase [Patescibacteria group bacterium]|nr:RluA family pseudouridine synthase [Patescibacteria group bacterium]
MDIKIIYEDKNILVIDKPTGIVVFPAAPEGEPPAQGKVHQRRRQRREKLITEKTVIDLLLKEFPYIKTVGESPRYGIVHRLDKETSGILLVAKNGESLKFLQKEFKERKVLKVYLLLITGYLMPSQGKIETLLGRAPKNQKKQKAFSFNAPEAKKKGLRKAITEYRTLEKFKEYTLIEAIPKTGRKHQIRCHFSYLGHPIAGDKLYGFKGQQKPKNLRRHFLHASRLKIISPDGVEKEFKSKLSEDLEKVLKKLNYGNKN